MRWRLLGSGVTLVALSACAASPSAPGTPAPPAPVEATAVVTGTLRGDILPASRMGPYTTPLTGADVVVTSGPGTGIRGMTDDTGTYRLTIPAGAFRLHFAKAGFAPFETATLTSGTDAVVGIPEVVLPVAPWVIAGQVTDSLGRPVADAEVWLDANDALRRSYGRTTTGADGRFRHIATLPQSNRIYVSVRRAGYVPMYEERYPCCASDGDTVIAVTVVRIVSVTQDGPAVLSPGARVDLPAAHIVFDDGSARDVYILPFSDRPEIVAVERGDRGYVLRAIDRGQAVVTFDYHGTSATLTVRVE